MTKSRVHHPIFNKFQLASPRFEPPFRIDCLGVRARTHYMPPDWFDVVEQPKPNELLFEWIDLLDAIATGGEKITVIDLGAGYGRWLTATAAATRQLGKRFHVVGVEAEAQHFEWMLEHLKDNGIAEANYTAICGVVSDKIKDVHFVSGHSAEWYGQCVLPTRDGGYGDWPEAEVTTMRSIAAADLIAGFDSIDALHMDIQAEELHVVPSIMDVATRKVRRMHVETHWPHIDEALPAVFRRFGWTPRWQYPCDRKQVMTEFGPIDFLGGVQSWENPHFGRSRVHHALTSIKRRFF